MKFQSIFIHFHSRKSISKCRLENGGHFVSASMCWHTEANTRWTPLGRRHFQMQFCRWKCFNFDKNFTLVPKGPYDNKWSLVQVTAWRRKENKPLHEPMTTHFNDAYTGMHHLSCVSNLTIIGSDNGLSPGRRQAVIWTNAEILLIGSLGTNFNEILIKIHAFSFKKMHFKCRLENGGHFVSASMC